MVTAITLSTPIGVLQLIGSDLGLRRIVLPNGDFQSMPEGAADGVLGEAATQLNEYFAGQRREFAIPLDLAATSFRSSTQLALAKIPFGEVVTYGQLAASLGKAGAARAVGSACAGNPLPIILPCHRVVRADGSFGEYAGGAPMKQWLLDFEKTTVQD